MENKKTTECKNITPARNCYQGQHFVDINITNLAKEIFDDTTSSAKSCIETCKQGQCPLPKK